MATRSNLIIDDGFDRIQLYRHWDGYPGGEGGVLANLKKALPYAWPLPRFEAKDFAAALVRAWKPREGGGHIYIDGSPRKWELVHRDVEWVYVIKSKKGKVDPHGFIDTLVGEPKVEVYDWGPYSFGEADPNQVKPKPALTVKLTKAKKAGLAWQDDRKAA